MKRTIAIVGPTATGKTALAVELARRLGGEIINADALQVYRGLDIGTAKPAVEERGGVPHHLIDVLEPTESYSAGEFARRAREVIAQVSARGAVPIVVGGSGFYLRALFDGLSPIPRADPAVRERLRRRLSEEGLEVLRNELAAVDPTTEARLERGDSQRVLRALEVMHSTGRSLTDWHSKGSPEGAGSAPFQVALTLPRAILYDRIEDRVRQMVDAGWVDEVADLLRRCHSSAPAFQAIGYRQLAGYLEGRWPLEEAVEDTITATRQFAKRQLTWFRKQRDVRWFTALDPQICLKEVLRDLT